MPHVYGSPPGRPLQGRLIVLARPAGQSGALREQLEALGARVMLAPGICIEPCAPDAATLAELARLAEFDWLIFISTNAVAHGLPLLQAHPAWPGLRARLAAIGQVTAQALAAGGCGSVVVPEHGEDSEGLLRVLAQQALAGQRILIVRGQGGRELLADALRAAGAYVGYAEVYRRDVPQQDLGPLRDALQRQAVDAILALSSESIEGLRQQLGSPAQAALARVLWLVSHPRVAAAARAAGLNAVTTRGGASESALINALCTHLPRPDTDD